MVGFSIAGHILYVANPFLWAQVQKRFDSPTDDIRDIHDGGEYQEYVECGFLSLHNKKNVSLILNTDGVEIYNYHSSGKINVLYPFISLP